MSDGPSHARLYDQLAESVAHLRGRIGARAPTVALVLGSGLGAYADTLADPVRIPYGDIPWFPRGHVVGHKGQLVVGGKAGVVCAAMQGRVHYYEGHSALVVTFPLRTLIALGCRTVILTNAAGGLRHPPGTLMLIRDHINLMPESPLRGENDERIGPRFPDLSRVYDPALREVAHQVAGGLGVTLGEGVYAALAGPAYETPAEVRMLSVLGADACGMSTAPEAVVAVHMGARVLGISCITNAAAGLSGEPLSHAEVTETAERVRATFIALLDGVVARLPEAR